MSTEASGEVVEVRLEVVLYAIRYCIGRTSIAAATDGPFLVSRHAAMLVNRGWGRNVFDDVVRWHNDPTCPEDIKRRWLRASYDLGCMLNERVPKGSGLRTP